ncbi:hypothetical protein WICMUC_001920 [Wickerhamomyces mucosus]|uniref:Hsp70 nucleotide exchange factor FES1 n=1 Tax=Wickerhamomyces mucosus TaxID=1378264 RepID=A0A9P8TFM0_9ASCO|nr:hypothetical protein WICMUC_001920 [Wickerhamomyces mucosus]
MDKLLNWSLAQNDPETAKKAGAPDSELLAKLFGKADDPTLMKQNMELINDTELDIENKIIAFENFEMLIENLDNANNIENLKLWESLINQLNSEELEFRNLTCSIIGTSVQNNEKAQLDFNKYPQGFKSLIELSKYDEKARLKSLYALSNLIRNNSKSYSVFNDHKGWELLGPIITDSSIKENVRTRSLSLLSSILTILEAKSDIFQHLNEYEILEKLLASLNANSSINFIDKSLNILTHLINLGYEFNSKQLELLEKLVELVESNFKDAVNIDDFQLIKQVL